MQIEDKVLLSFYKEIDKFNNHLNISIVQHVETKKIYVKKVLSVYDKNLYSTLKELELPGIPKIMVIAEEDENLIVIEEYISGDSLSDYLDKNGPLDPITSLTVINKLCDILDNLHNLEPPVIHRDLTPSNIMLSYDMNVTLIDFNASRFFKTDKVCDTIPMGTVDYAAPEQYGFSQSDARTDIYALGIILNTMLTGNTPKTCIYNDRRISSVISKCINIDPDKRYRSVRKLKKAVKRIKLKHSKSPPYMKCSKKKKFAEFFPAAAILISSIIVSMVLSCGNAEKVFIPFTYHISSSLALVIMIFLSLRYTNIAKGLPIIKNNRTAVKIAGILILCSIIFAIIASFITMMFYSLKNPDIIKAG